MFGALPRNFHRSIGQDNYEFIAAIAAGNVIPADWWSINLPNSRRMEIACSMAVRIVVTLELIHVQHNDADERRFCVRLAASSRSRVSSM